MQLAFVEETGREATCALRGVTFEVSYDGFSQAALPWHPARAGWDAARLLRDVQVLRGVSDRLRELSSTRQALGGRGKQDVGLDANRACTDYLPALAHALDTVSLVSVRDLKSRIASITGADAVGTHAALDAFGKLPILCSAEPALL